MTSELQVTGRHVAPDGGETIFFRRTDGSTGAFMPGEMRNRPAGVPTEEDVRRFDGNATGEPIGPEPQSEVVQPDAYIVG